MILPIRIIAIAAAIVIVRSSFAGDRVPAAASPRIDEVAILDEPGGRIVAFSRDGKRILTADGTAAQIWDAATWQPVGARMEHGPGLQMAATDAAGVRVLTVGTVSENGKVVSGEAKVWDGRSGQLLLPGIRHGDRPVSAAAISPDGTLVATCFEEDRRVRVWDVASGRERIVLDHSYRVGAVRFDPTGRTLVATGAENTVWNVRSWRVERTFPGSVASGPPTPAFTPDGRLVAIPRDDRFELYDFVTGRKIGDNAAHFLHGDAFMSAVALSPNGRLVASTSTDGGAVWDARTGEPLISGIDAFHGQPAFSPDGGLVILNTGTDAAIWNVLTRSRIALGRRLSPQAACFSPDGNALAVATFDGSTAILRISGSGRATRPATVDR